MQIKDKKLLKRIILLSIPSAVDYALQSAANYADYIMVGKLSQNASASIGLTTEVNFFMRGLLTALGIGIVSFVAISEGRGEKENSRKVFPQAFCLAGVSGLLLIMIVLLISAKLPCWMGADESIWKMSSDYFLISGLGLFGAAFNMMFGSVLKGYGNMKTPMYVNVGMNLLNILLNFLLIFNNNTIKLAGCALTLKGAGLGINGAAYATAIANTAGGLCMVVAAYRKYNKITGKMDIKAVFPDRTIIKRILLVAFPAFLCRTVTSTGRIIFTTFVTGLGTTAFAAHSIAFTAESLFYMPVVGAQSAVTTLAGNAKGENDGKKLHSLVYLSCCAIAGFMLIAGIIMFIFAGPVLSFFTKDSQVIEIGKVLFYIVAVNEPIFGISVVMEGIFNGLGDSKRTFYISAFTLWTVRVAGSWFAIHILQAGVYGAWVCMVLENASRGIILILFYFKIYKKKYIM